MKSLLSVSPLPRVKKGNRNRVTYAAGKKIENKQIETAKKLSSQPFEDLEVFLTPDGNRDKELSDHEFNEVLAVSENVADSGLLAYDEKEKKSEFDSTSEGKERSPRAKVARRRQIDPTTCERDYSLEEIEFMNALDNYKRASGRMFPTCSEILEVFRSLGYVKRSEISANEDFESIKEDNIKSSTPIFASDELELHKAKEEFLSPYRTDRETLLFL